MPLRAMAFMLRFAFFRRSGTGSLGVHLLERGEGGSDTFRSNFLKFLSALSGTFRILKFLSVLGILGRTFFTCLL